MNDKTYFYLRNNLNIKAFAVLNMNLKEIKEMIFDIPLGSALNQEDMREQYIKDNHYSGYDREKYILSEYKYDYPKIVNGVIEKQTDEDRKINGTLKLEANEIIENGKVIKLTDDEMKVRGLKDLVNGEYISDDNELIRVPIPLNMVIPFWNKETNVWEETATVEEIGQYYYDQNTPVANYILEKGFYFEEKYIQRINDHIIAVLGNLIASLDKKIKDTGNTELKEGWSFDDAGNSGAMLGIESLENLRDEGVEFFKAVGTARGHFIQQRLVPDLQGFMQVLNTLTTKSVLYGQDLSNVIIGGA